MMPQIDPNEITKELEKAIGVWCEKHYTDVLEIDYYDDEVVIRHRFEGETHLARIAHVELFEDQPNN